MFGARLPFPLRTACVEIPWTRPGRPNESNELSMKSSRHEGTMQRIGDDLPDALVAAALIAVNPFAIGGAVVRGRWHAGCDSWLGAIQALLPATAPVRRIPSHANEGRVIGELDLSASLRLGRP